MNDRKGPQDYLKYSSIGIQMMVIVLLFTFAGYWLDGKAGNSKPLFTVFLSLAGVAIALIWVVKETARKPKR